MRTHLCRMFGPMPLQSVRSSHTATWPVPEAARPHLGMGAPSPPDRCRRWSPPPVTPLIPMASIALPPAPPWCPLPQPPLCPLSMPSAVSNCPRTSPPNA